MGLRRSHNRFLLCELLGSSPAASCTPYHAKRKEEMMYMTFALNTQQDDYKYQTTYKTDLIRQQFPRNE